MMDATPVEPPGARLASRLIFFIAGFGGAAWAPLVPYVKLRLGADEATMGTLLLCLGAGSVCAMPLSSSMAVRLGFRTTVLISAIGLLLTLPLLATSASLALLAATLLVFGGSLGTLDVVANLHGVVNQALAGRPLLSNFHAFFSVGGLSGAALVTAMLALGVAPLYVVAVPLAVIAGCIAVGFGHFLRRPSGGQKAARAGLCLPSGVVLLVGVLAFAVFLVEGAMLDWSAILLTEAKDLPSSLGGSGYAVFAATMVVGRGTGDVLTRRLGPARILLTGGGLVCIGLLTGALAPGGFALLGFAATGLGAANLVPIFYSVCGRQSVMPVPAAVSCISVMGYAGILCGPALIGYVAKVTSLSTTFTLLGIVLLAVPASFRIVASASR